MKRLHRILSLLLLTLLCTALLAMPAAASSTFMEYEGLEVTVEMDKEEYDTGEPITATITVKNTSDQIITIANLEQLIPEGYRLAADSQASAQNIELLPGRTTVLAVTFEGDAAAGEAAEDGGFGWSFLNTLLYGETMGVPNLLIAVLAAIAIAIFMFLT